MKKLLTIIALAFALAAPALAQNTTQKINKKNLVIKEWNTEPRSGKKVLDHVTTFDADGKKIEEIAVHHRPGALCGDARHLFH